MIRTRIQIDGGEILDTYDAFGFIYKSSDNRFSPPEKELDTSSYAEEDGEHVDLRTVYDAFDYNVEFVIEAYNRNFENANSKIKAFNDAIRDYTDKIKTCKYITFYNDFKRCKITGIPKTIQTVGEDDFFRRADGSIMDCVVVQLTIRVTDPTKCDFDTQTQQ